MGLATGEDGPFAAAISPTEVPFNRIAVVTGLVTGLPRRLVHSLNPITATSFEAIVETAILRVVVAVVTLLDGPASFIEIPTDHPITTAGPGAVITAGIPIIVVAIVTVRLTGIEATIATDFSDTVWPATIAFVLVTVVAFFGPCFARLDVCSLHSIATDGDLAVTPASVPILIVAIIAGFKSRLIGAEIRPEDTIATGRLLAVVRTAVIGRLVTIVAGLALLQDAVATAAVQTVVTAIFWVRIITIVAGFELFRRAHRAGHAVTAAGGFTVT